ncbi:DNA-binding transcriptional MerR regulator [Prauserella isguenensis]|uniref:DNA-binding transcriptional MerR regulator n=1 Tax=Prauserella isguenensis TaxID=1470180 RepID=A0A839S2X0_9PSEU|nr:MerR family transcriptional regulator [Prauserella isguenensis]MBB3052055.1 DNA-binding transcriptional MerR regulator [Prauserella isguenensis]
MRIGELAAASGVSARSLRYYEQQGLIEARRTAGGWRNFDESMVERVVLIQHLFAAGLCSGTVYQLLPCLQAPPEERTGVMERLLADEVARLQDKRRDIERELEILQALREDTASGGNAAASRDRASPRGGTARWDVSSG